MTLEPRNRQPHWVQCESSARRCKMESKSYEPDDDDKEIGS